MSSDNLNPDVGNNPMGVSEKKIVLRMIGTFKRHNDMHGLRLFLGTKMKLDVQEIEQAIAAIDENLPVILSFNR